MGPKVSNKIEKKNKIKIGSNKKDLQINILEQLIMEIKKKIDENYNNYFFELKYDSIVTQFFFSKISKKKLKRK